jgi:hypothetical protein
VSRGPELVAGASACCCQVLCTVCKDGWPMPQSMPVCLPAWEPPAAAFCFEPRVLPVRLPIVFSVSCLPPISRLPPCAVHAVRHILQAARQAPGTEAEAAAAADAKSQQQWAQQSQSQQHQQQAGQYQPQSRQQQQPHSARPERSAVLLELHSSSSASGSVGDGGSGGAGAGGGGGSSEASTQHGSHEQQRQPGGGRGEEVCKPAGQAGAPQRSGDAPTTSSGSGTTSSRRSHPAPPITQVPEVRPAGRQAGSRLRGARQPHAHA